MKTQMKSHIVSHFIRVCTVCLDKIDLRREKYNFFLIITCDPSIYTIDHLDLALSNFMGISIDLKRVNGKSIFIIVWKTLNDMYL